jgi:hypothetical protein
MPIHRITFTEHGPVTDIIDHSPATPRRSVIANEVMRTGGGFRTAVLDTLGVQPGDPDFEEKRDRFMAACRNATKAQEQHIGSISLDPLVAYAPHVPGA